MFVFTLSQGSHQFGGCFLNFLKGIWQYEAATLNLDCRVKLSCLPRLFDFNCLCLLEYGEYSIGVDLCYKKAGAMFKASFVPVEQCL